MASPKSYLSRLKKEYIAIKRNPPPNIDAAPLPTNILEWHFCLFGLTDCPYEGGFFHGKLVFPEEYPFKPPSILMVTPTGRFQPNTRLCLSISDYHPDTWNPIWSVESIIKGLMSFMLEDTATAGSIVSSVAEKRRLARESGAFNCTDADSTLRQIAGTIKKALESAAPPVAAAAVSDSSRIDSDRARAGGVPGAPDVYHTGGVAINVAVVVTVVVVYAVVRFVLDRAGVGAH